MYFQLIFLLENNTITLFYKWTKIVDELFDFFFLLAHYLLKQIPLD